MVDRTSARLEVVRIGEGEEQAFLDIIDHYGLSADGYSSFPSTDKVTTIELGIAYTDSEFGMGYGEDLAATLLEKAPNSYWEFIEDPNYEYMGTYHCFIPALGYYSTSCNGEGQPIFTADQVLNMTKLSEVDLLRELGLMWQLEFRRLSKLVNEENA